LEDFLENFSGCLVLVSHDRYFMDHLVDHLFIFEGNGSIRLFNGNYTDYRTQEDAKQVSKPERESPSPRVTTTPSEKRKASFKEKQEYDRLQSEIEALEKRKAELTEKMSGGTTDHVVLTEWSQEIQQLNEAIDEKTLRWLELSEIIG
jgi:ATP-binding cassette subfamily F protein uup